MFRNILEHQFSADIVSKSLVKVVRKYGFDGKDKSFVENFFPRSELVRTGKDSYLDNMNLHSDLKSFRFSASIVNRIYRAWDEFKSELKNSVACCADSIMKARTSGNWMILEKSSGILIVGVSEHDGEIEMGKDIQESIAKASKFYNGKFHLQEGYWVFEETPPMTYTETDVTTKLATAKQVLNELEGWAEDIGATQDHVRDAIQMNQGEIAFQFNIKMPRVEFPESVRREAQERPEEVDRVYYQIISERLDEFMEQLKAHFPNVMQIGQAGRSGGWLVVSFTDVQDDLNSAISAVEGDLKSDKDYQSDIDSLTPAVEGAQKILDGIKYIQSALVKAMELLVKDLEEESFWKENIKMGESSQEQNTENSHWFYISRKSKESPVKEADVKTPEVLKEPSEKDPTSYKNVFTEKTATFDLERAISILSDHASDPSWDEMKLIDWKDKDAQGFVNAAQEYFYTVYGTFDDLAWETFKREMHDEFGTDY